MFCEKSFQGQIMFAKFMHFLNRHRWKIYLLWTIPTFFLWTWLGYEEWKLDPDAPGGIYIFLGWVFWFILHFCTAISLGVCLAIWRWWMARKMKKSEA